MIRKRSVTIRGHRTSFSLEDEFWQALRAIAADRCISLSTLIVEIDENRRPEENLSSALRVYVLKRLQSGRSD